MGGTGRGCDGLTDTFRGGGRRERKRIGEREGGRRRDKNIGVLTSGFQSEVYGSRLYSVYGATLVVNAVLFRPLFGFILRGSGAMLLVYTHALDHARSLRHPHIIEVRWRTSDLIIIPTGRLGITIIDRYVNFIALTIPQGWLIHTTIWA